jgi:HEAT repeat protein
MREKRWVWLALAVAGATLFWGAPGVGQQPRSVRDVREAREQLEQMLVDLARTKMRREGKTTVADLLRTLRDPSSGSDAARVLFADYPENKEALPLLVKHLQSSESAVRSHAAKVLAVIGPKAVEAIPVLVRALRDPERSVRIEAVRALGKLDSCNADCIPVLTEMLKERSWLERIRALHALGRIGAAARAAVPAVRAALQDEHPLVRKMAAMTLEDLGDSESKLQPDEAEEQAHVPKQIGGRLPGAGVDARAAAEGRRTTAGPPRPQGGAR